MKYLVVIISLLQFLHLIKSSCNVDTKCAYKYFGSRSSYDYNRGDMRYDAVKLEGCKPISIWGIYRHGKRTPDRHFAINMKDALAIRDEVIVSYKNNKSSLCGKDVERLKNWEAEERLLDGKQSLIKEGHDEHFGIGERLKQAFPELLSVLGYGNYILRPEFNQRMVDSGNAFIKGLGQNLTLEAAIPDGDIMAPYGTCPAYQLSVRHNPEFFSESMKYFHSPDFIKVKQRIQRRTGINYNLTSTLVMTLVDLCRFTCPGSDNKISPWCALLTEEDLEILEYVTDLRHYYRNGYGTPKNEIFGQITLTDLLKSFQKVIDSEGKKLTAYFTHGTMLDMISNALGLFKDSRPLTASFRDPHRKWKTSKMSNFAVNYMSVLYRCSMNHTVDHNVVFYINEKPIRSICKGVACSWQEFHELLKPFEHASFDCMFKSSIDEGAS